MKETDYPVLQTRNLKDAVACRVREQIFSGALRPGTKIDQNALAESMGVSKLPLREALISLEAEALVVNVPRRGAYVAQLTEDDVRDHYHIYGLISAVAAERAAERLTDAQLDELAEILAEMETSEEPERLERLNFLFHRAINRAGGSRRLHSVIRLLAESIPARFYEFTTGWSEVAHRDHLELLAALKRRDGGAAREMMATHLRQSGEHAVTILRSIGFWDEDGSPT